VKKRFAFKPEGGASKDDYEVKSCPLKVAKALVREYHYAKGSSMMGWAHCLTRKSTGEVVGAAIWLPPTKNAAKYILRVKAARLLEPFLWNSVMMRDTGSEVGAFEMDLITRFPNSLYRTMAMNYTGLITTLMPDKTPVVGLSVTPLGSAPVTVTIRALTAGKTPKRKSEQGKCLRKFDRKIY
jgi:hypothetical protein